MPIRCVIFLLLAGLMTTMSSARAEDDEPSFSGKKLSYWLDLVEKGKDQKDRRRGILGLEQIGHFGSRKVTPALVKALREDQDAKVRASAARAVGRVTARAMEKGREEKKDELPRVDPIRDALVAALRTEKEGAVREAAALALGDLGAEARGAVGTLAQALKDKNDATVKAAAQSLRRLGKEARDAQLELQALLTDKKADPEARTDAAHSIGQIKPDVSQALPVLREVLADEKADERIRKAAAEALGKLGKDGADGAATLGAVLVAKESSTDLRLAAAGAIDQFGPDGKGAIPSLIKATGDPALVKSMGDSGRYIRCLAMHALGRMGKELDKDRKEAIAVLLKTTDDPNVEVCTSALETLGSLAEFLGDSADEVAKKLDAILQREGRKSVREAATAARDRLKSVKKG